MAYRMNTQQQIEAAVHEFDQNTTWEVLYILVSPNPYKDMQLRVNGTLCYEMKIGDGREDEAQKQYATHNPHAAITMIQVPKNIAQDLKKWNVPTTKSTGVGKILETALFGNAPLQETGLIRTEWYTLTLKATTNESHFVQQLKYIFNAYGNHIVYPDALDDYTHDYALVSDLWSSLVDITQLCNVQRSRSVEYVNGYTGWAGDWKPKPVPAGKVRAKK